MDMEKTDMGLNLFWPVYMYTVPIQHVSDLRVCDKGR